MKGWHFVGDQLRDGMPVPEDGVWLEHKGELRMCRSGLHYSTCPFDALTYAPGPVLCRVEVEESEYEDDKGVARRRKILHRFDATGMLREFARSCALDVIHLWDAPDVVREFLESGDESLRAAARAAAARAAGVAARAAWDAARDVRAARAARDAARDAVWDAVWAAARAAGDAGDAGAAQRARFVGMVEELSK